MVQEASIPQTRRPTSVEISSTAAVFMNKMYNESRTNLSNGVRALVDWRVVKRHDTSTVVSVDNKLDRQRVLVTISDEIF